MNTEFKPWGMEKQQFIPLMHIAQFAGLVTGGLGFILPLVMWLLNKDFDSDIDAHGKKIVNWSISMFIYIIVAIILSFLLIGLPFILGLIVISFVFPILGAVKATNGELYNYPFTINFIK